MPQYLCWIWLCLYYKRKQSPVAQRNHVRFGDLHINVGRCYCLGIGPGFGFQTADDNIIHAPISLYCSRSSPSHFVVSILQFSFIKSIITVCCLERVEISSAIKLSALLISSISSLFFFGILMFLLKTTLFVFPLSPLSAPVLCPGVKSENVYCMFHFVYYQKKKVCYIDSFVKHPISTCCKIKLS